jgi:tetratricopeptide (TPR) repeat protein
MKKIAALVFSFSIGVMALNAQNSERTSAFMGMNNYLNSKNKVEDAYLLDRAKISIDKATVHPDTKDEAKTWVYRGQIYLIIYQKDFKEKMDAHAEITDPGKKSSTAYLEVSLANLTEATTSLLHGKSLDSKKVYEVELAKGLGDCYFYLQNAGIVRFNQKQYADAYPLFSMAADITASDRKTDTLNISNAASCAYNAKLFDKALLNYKKLTDVGYGKGNTWMMMGRIYAESGDSAKYISTISEGLKKYPNDPDLLTEDVNIKMKNGQITAAIDELNALIAQRPNDAQLNFVVGNVYDRTANPNGPDGKPAPKPKNYEEMLAKAGEYYKKAIELDPKNFDATFNLGLLYYNQSVEYYNRSQETIAESAKYKDMWEKPLPDAAKYLEAAHALDPKDLTVLNALKAVYSQMSDNDNYIRIKEEIKKVQAGG